ncbi:phospholipase D family protein [Aestuariicella hydrocarbonica]|uniref:Phospholipase D family protein n=1 Tax=Pseudomaricurvus hydrocarbonicus TaxID=1470433 RepID=A0A9E5JT02_9GAMM|nr:phospholipase D family protein [Aestuariicella hydrocarbonica]NHO64080.1 phospholipase D family protein [Aestuariicella hydrocarbonica]
MNADPSGFYQYLISCHPFRALLPVTLLMLAMGCSSLKLDVLAPEYTPAAAPNDLWDELAARRQGDWQVLLSDGGLSLDWRLLAIDSATESIDLQTFLWSHDVVGSMVMDHLIQAADRGVQVKLLIDDTFLAGDDAATLALHEHPNIEYRIYNPYKRRMNGLVIRTLVNLTEFHRLDHRMHNKAMIVDNRVAIVGGRNLADEYYGLHGLANFRDMELLVGGSIITDLTRSFDQYWNDLWSLPVERLSHVTEAPFELEQSRQVTVENTHLHREESDSVRKKRWLQLVDGAYSGEVVLYVDVPAGDNPADSDSAPVQVANEIIALFDQAEEEILIISAYLIPTIDLEGAIERAVDRGVRIRILTNSLRSNNHLAAHSAYRNHIHTLMSHGAKLHEVRADAKQRFLYMFPPTDSKSLALHAKVLVIDDDKVFIGSANLDPRSLKLNTEMGLLVKDQALNKAVRSSVEPDFTKANAWHLELNERDQVTWVSDDLVLTSQPANSFMQRIEDWFISHMPVVEGEM